MAISVPAKRMYTGLKNVHGYDVSGQNAEWLRSCINECTKPEERLPADALDLQKLIFIAKFIGVPGVQHIKTPVGYMH